MTPPMHIMLNMYNSGFIKNVMRSYIFLERQNGIQVAYPCKMALFNESPNYIYFIFPF